jgi:organic radical activating enzyme
VKILFISLIMACNKSCYYCPTKKWHREVGANGLPVNTITNEGLLKWLDKYIDPNEWIIELTGGEPGLYKEIDTLIPALNEKGYCGLIKTNGSFPIPKSKNFQLVTAWHAGEDFPQNYDQILIIKNPKDDWKAKVDYCKQNNIHYKTTLFDDWYRMGKSFAQGLLRLNKSSECLHINSTGQITPCSKVPIDEDCNIFNMSPPVPLKSLGQQCPRCKNINDVEVFLTEELKQKFENGGGE